jgi:Fic family protein
LNVIESVIESVMTKSWAWQRDDWGKWEVTSFADSSSLESAVRAVSRINVLSSQFANKDKIAAEAKFLEEESIQTSYIEGKVLDRDSVRSSIARKLGILPISHDSTHRTRNADGLVETLIDATGNYVEPLSHERLFRWQASLFPSGRDEHGYPIEVGHYRTSGEEMKVVSISSKGQKEFVHYIAPPSQSVHGEMERFIVWFNSTSRNPSFLRAAMATYWFVSIHPFEDGNGRLCRVIADMSVAQAEKSTSRLYSLSNTLIEDKHLLNRYYETLEQCQKGTQPFDKWLGFFLDAIQASAERAEVSLDDILKKTMFWDACRDTQLSERQKKYLNFVLDKGSFWKATKIDRKSYKDIVGGISPATAKRDLQDLAGKGVLITKDTIGRNASYEINSELFG